MTRFRNSMIIVVSFAGFVGTSLFFVYLQPKYNAAKWRRIQEENWKGVEKGYREAHQPGGMSVWRNPFDKSDKK